MTFSSNQNSSQNGSTPTILKVMNHHSLNKDLIKDIKDKVLMILIQVWMVWMGFLIMRVKMTDQPWIKKFKRMITIQVQFKYLANLCWMKNIMIMMNSRKTGMDQRILLKESLIRSKICYSTQIRITSLKAMRMKMMKALMKMTRT
jgi:hypothetical protein